MDEESPQGLFSEMKRLLTHEKKFIISHRFSVEVQRAGLSFVVALENKATEFFTHKHIYSRLSLQLVEWTAAKYFDVSPR